MLRMAKLLRKSGVSPAVLSSPLPRAVQTAEIVAKCLCADLKPERALGKGFNAAKLREIIKRNEVDELMIVGHEPDFSAVIRALTGGEVKLGKGGLARVDIQSGQDAGRLVWLIQLKVARVKG